MPFYLRSGKCPATRATEIVVELKPAPHTPFSPRGAGGAVARPNRLVATISPHEGVVLQVVGKLPGQETSSASLSPGRCRSGRWRPGGGSQRPVVAPDLPSSRLLQTAREGRYTPELEQIVDALAGGDRGIARVVLQNAVTPEAEAEPPEPSALLPGVASLSEHAPDHGESEMSHREPPTDGDLGKLQRDSFDYFLHEASTANGLVIDKTAPDWPASIAATGLALAAYPVGVERGYMSRAAAVERTLITLRFFWSSPQGPEPDATGYQGFYYHFLDMWTGRRAWQCELSTVDSTFLLAGALTARLYFDADTADEREIRSLADALYRRADWQWAQNGGATVTHGWTPEGGFLGYRWKGYDEALLLYVLGLGSPTHPLPETSYSAWCSTYEWKRIYGQEYLYAGPLFTHQLSHVWIDFRGIQDAFMRDKGIDYFENSRRATYVQQRYAIDNPLGFEAYDRDCWGITASEGPGPRTMSVNGIERQFFDYVARGVPYGPDDGTLAPWAVVASLPFAPEIVLPALGYCLHEANLTESNPYGFKASFNPTFPEKSGNPHAWVSPWHFGLNQGPIILMIENHRTGLLWRLTRHCPYLATGLRRAGFSGGWL